MGDARGGFNGGWWRNMSPVTLPLAYLASQPEPSVSGRTSPSPLEFVDEVCIVNTFDLRLQMTAPVERLSSAAAAGLCKDFIDKNLKRGKTVDLKLCVICQEEEREEIVGILKCGHEYHCSCINTCPGCCKKNICPLCKSRAL